MDTYIVYYENLPSQGSQIASLGRLRGPQKLGDVHAARGLAMCMLVKASPCALRSLGAIQIPV
jgi:hypothetical protein